MKRVFLTLVCLITAFLLSLGSYGRVYAVADVLVLAQDDGDDDSELDAAKIAAKREVIDFKTSLDSKYVYDTDKTLAATVVTDYCGAGDEQTSAPGGKIGTAQTMGDVESLRQEATAALTKTSDYSQMRSDAIKDIDEYLAYQKYGKADDEKKDTLYETYCGSNGQIATAADDQAIAVAKDQCLAELKTLEGGPLYNHIDDAENQQAANSGNGSTSQTTMRYLLVKKDGKEPSIEGSVVNQFFNDLNYMGRYIELRVYKEDSHYPAGTPELVFQLTPELELNGVIDPNKDYTVPEIQELVKQKTVEPTSFLLKALTDMSQHQAGNGTVTSKYKYYLKKDAPITGSVIEDLISNKKYAVIRDYYSEDAYAAGADPKHTITITPDTLFSKTISPNEEYTINDLITILITVDSVMVNPETTGLKDVYTGKSYQFKAIVSGTNTSALELTWSVKNNKSSDTAITKNGLLKVGSGENTDALTVTATVGYKEGSYLVTVRKSKSPQPMAVKAKKVTLKKKNKKQTIKKEKAFKISNAKGTVTFKKISGSSKVSINKSGKITVKKKTKKGKYIIKVKVSASGNDSYEAGSKIVKVTIKIR